MKIIEGTLSVAPMLDWTDGTLQHVVSCDNKSMAKSMDCNKQCQFNATALPMAFVDAFNVYKMALFVLLTVTHSSDIIRF
jgi:hypothetical protein